MVFLPIALCLGTYDPLAFAQAESTVIKGGARSREQPHRGSKAMTGLVLEQSKVRSGYMRKAHGGVRESITHQKLFGFPTFAGGLKKQKTPSPEVQLILQESF
ncbi:hypothetical protein CROQUDRAFT_97414 [Cronartium quercuum f. sp. fusiforme G11]|uniref:Secreted protein n=1 Tax=Cronartium quercuum f. sp. fusiforme G11 TaxID=708437 RepID=A0A9P6NEG6_9BASI|nr:hypothetical protein CROQUDRAFT_97414 [Cronartium quercuum f. sp. fusiforme G11]